MRNLKKFKNVFMGFLIILLILVFYYVRGGYVDPNNVEIINVLENENQISFDIEVVEPELLYAAIGRDVDNCIDSRNKTEEVYIRCNIAKKLRILSKKEVNMHHFDIDKQLLKNTGATKIYYGQGTKKVLIWEKTD